MTGRIKRIYDAGFGFIKIGPGKDVFLHISQCPPGTVFDEGLVGRQVTFDVREDVKGPRAINVQFTEA